MVLEAGELQTAETAALLPSLETNLKLCAGIRRVTWLVSEGQDPPPPPTSAYLARKRWLAKRIRQGRRGASSPQATRPLELTA